MCCHFGYERRPTANANPRNKNVIQGTQVNAICLEALLVLGSGVQRHRLRPLRLGQTPGSTQRSPHPRTDAASLFAARWLARRNPGSTSLSSQNKEAIVPDHLLADSLRAPFGGRGVVANVRRKVTDELADNRE